jgi:M6 family metalloprotease-like protein
MKKNLLFILTMLSFLTMVKAAYFERQPYTISQPNGITINCFVSGDEFFNWIHDGEGYTIIQASNGYYYYAEKNGDVIQASNYLVNSVNPANVGLSKWVKISKAEYLSRRAARFSYEKTTNNGPSNAPHSGTMNNLVVYIRFSNDAEFTTTRQVYDNKFNPTTGVSLKSYFKEVSYNNLTISSTHYPACALTTNLSYQDSHARGYFQPYNASTNTIGYSTETERTTREHTLLVNAINWININSPVSTSLNIDGDNDNNIDNVCFIIKGNAGGWSDLLWAHRWSLYTQNVYINSKRVYGYTFQPENQVDVTTLCHEMFHALGSPDLYHYDDGGLNISPVWDWDLMESGAGHMLTYMKWKYSNQTWITSIPQITTNGTYTLNPVTSATNNCYKIASPNSLTEYFVVEYRNASGTFETNIPGSGLIVYRVDTQESGNANGPPDEVYIYRPNGTTTVNGTPDNAFFSSTVGRTAINNTTNPSCFLQNGSTGGLNISNVTSAGATISFTVSIPNSCTPPTTQATAFASSALTNNSMTIGCTRGNGSSIIIVARQGSAVNTNPIDGITYTANAAFGSGTQIGTGNYVVYKGTGNSVNITALTSGTNYHYAIYEYNSTGLCYKVPALIGNATTTGTAPCNYCTSNGNMDYLTSLTLVNFNTINNATSKIAAYNDYTTISTTVNKNSTYNLIAKLNSDGNYTIHAFAWIDWNKDCDFLDAGESYDLGTAMNVSNGITSLSPLSITIPSTAVTGNTRMRVAAKFDSDPTSCETAFDGEVEDYTINITSGSNLSVLPSIQNVASSAGSTSFTVTSSVAWNAVSNQTWCTVTPSGTGNGTLIASFSSNPLTLARTAIITVSGTGVSPIAVNVVQSGLTSAIWSSTMSNTTDWTVTNASNATLATQWVRLTDTSYASSFWKLYVGPYMGSATPMNGVYNFDGITNLVNGIYGISNSRLTNTTPINTIGHPSVKIKFYQLYKSFNADSTFLEISNDNVNWYSIDVNPIAAANQYAYGWKEFNIGPWAGNKSQVWIRFRFYAPAVAGTPPLGQYSGGYGWMIDDVSIEDTPQNSLSIDKLWIYDGYTQIPVAQNRPLALQAQVTNNGAATQNNLKLKALELSTSAIYSNSFSQSLLSAAIDTLDLDSISLPNVAGDYYIAPFVSSDNLQVLYNDTIKITLNNTNLLSRDNNYYYSSRWNNGNACVIANMYEIKQQAMATSINFVVNLTTKVNSSVKTVLYRGAGQNRVLIAESSFYTITSANIPTTVGLNPPSITIPFTTPVLLSPDSIYWAGVQMLGGTDTIKIAIDNTAPLQNYYTSALFDAVNSQWYVWSLDQVYPSMIRLNLAGSTLSVTPSSQNVSSTAGSTQFAVTSANAWTAISNQTWCTVTPSGSGSGSLVANYTANTSTSTRTATITINASGSNPVLVTVIQSGTGGAIWPQSFEEANFPPTAWTVQNPIGGTGWESSLVGTTPVPGFTGGDVTSCPGGGNKMALVYYGSGSATSNNQWLISPLIVVSANKVLKFYMRKFGSYADTMFVKVSTTNNQTTSFSSQLAMIGFSAADSGWVQYTYNLAAYTGQQIYIAFNEKITDNQTDGAALFLDMVDITDNSSNPSLSVTPSSQNVNSTAGSTQFAVTSTVSWTASSNQTWCTVTPSGTGNGTITANYTANSSTTSRTATITVSGTGVASQNVTVIQSGTGGAIWPQSFEETNFPPTAWTVQNPIGGTGWESSLVGTTPVPGFTGGDVTSCPGGGNKMALVYYGSGSATSNNQWLISPSIVVSANKVLKFYLRKFGSYADTMFVKVSTTNNQTTSFSSQLAMIGFSAADSGWVQYTYNLAAYTGQQIYIAFNEKITDNQTDGAALFLDMVDIADNSSNPTLSVTPSSQNVSSTAGSTQFAVTSTVLWTASSNQTWCTVTPSGTGNGIITANYTANSSTTSRTATITVSGTGVNSVLVTVVQSGTAIPDPAGTITGSTTVCQGQNNVVYTVPVINNATTYIWTLPNGAIGSSTTNSITINFGTTAVSGNITVKGSNSSGDGIASSLSIIVNPLPLSAGSINGQTSICQGQGNVVYSVPVITNATSYLWTLPSGASGSSTANSITVNYNSSATSGNITVKGQNSCGVGTLSSLFVVVNSTPPAPTITQNVNTLTSSSANGNQWYNLATGIINNALAQSYMPQQIGNYFVIVTLNGCSSDSSNIIYYNNNEIFENQYVSIKVTVVPNPFTDNTTLNYTLNENKHLRLSITDITGKEIRVLCDNEQGKGEHNLIFKAENLAKGIYFYKLNADKEVITGKIILTK